MYHRIKRDEDVTLECEHCVTDNSFLGFDRNTSCEPNSWPAMTTNPFPSRAVPCFLQCHSSGPLALRIGAAVPPVCSGPLPAWESTAAAGMHIHSYSLSFSQVCPALFYYPSGHSVADLGAEVAKGTQLNSVVGTALDISDEGRTKPESPSWW